jgi:sulfur carrier protein
VSITINGQPQQVAQGTSLLELLEQLHVNRQQVAVELNAELIPRERHGRCLLSAGDRLEIVTLVGGG